MRTIGKIILSLFLVIVFFFVWHLFSGSQFCWGDPTIDADQNGVADNCFVTSE